MSHYQYYEKLLSMVTGYYSERSQIKVSKGKKVHGERSRNSQIQVLGPLPVDGSLPVPHTGTL